jgi:hypothetical protein
MPRCRYCGKELKPGQNEYDCPERPCAHCGEPLRGRCEEKCAQRVISCSWCDATGYDQRTTVGTVCRKCHGEKYVKQGTFVGKRWDNHM